MTFACIVCRLRFPTAAEYEAHFNKKHHRRLTARKKAPNPHTSEPMQTEHRDPKTTHR